MARQLFRNVSKATAGSSSFHPSSVEKLSGSIRALRRFKADAGSLGVAISQKQKPTIQEERRTIPCMPSLPGFSGKKLPVRIARGDVASKCPDVRNVGYALGVAINDIAILVARY